MTAKFDNSYARFPARFFARQMPDAAPAPQRIAANGALAERLGFGGDWIAGPEGLAMTSGNAMPSGAEPLAQAYAGHQFGGWVPQLGDGRAVLLGEIIAPDGARFDIQLKGSGQTPFSRRGDGKAWLGPVLREYVVSEAMAALGIPTTRALAAVLTGEAVYRDGFARPGAILTRVASSHIRVGTFQYFAAREDTEALQLLTDHVIARHYPQAETPLELLTAVVAAQARLIARWLSVGFIHGVMNTDNMSISGETIDYGPCAFMDHYHPSKVFSSIDAYGRYAYGAQPQIAAWNLAQFASCLLPLMGEREAAIEAATITIGGFTEVFQAEWLALFGRKIGITAPRPEDRALIEDLLNRMAVERADFTRTFRGLSTGTARAEFTEPLAFDQWSERWQTRLAEERDPEAVMATANPVRIPRNHRIEAMIASAVEDDFAPFETLMAALAAPFDPAPEFAAFEAAPRPDEAVARTFCGT
ncbi:YdiU family protein [Thioclava sp. A2]|uniref:protein adenylyltransferase SelO n=1 Tax=Thioclava sp. FCG-A2 TaxID=3080562 RepID=UPI00295516D5|nr:YdiU family protein [Thioclava sp. A2]MDV7269569.1 YdiU family protein [Thioclava sp. A2]